MQNSPFDSSFLDVEEDTLHSATQSEKAPQKARLSSGNRPLDSQQAPQNYKKARAVSLSSPQAALRAVERSSPARDPRGVSVALHIVEDRVEDWLADGVYEGNSPLTLRSKKDALEKFIWFLNKQGTHQVRAADVKRFLAHVKNGHLEPAGRFGARSLRSYKPVSDRTVQLYFVNIRCYFGFLAEEGDCSQ